MEPETDSEQQQAEPTEEMPWQATGTSKFASDGAALSAMPGARSSLGLPGGKSAPAASPSRPPAPSAAQTGSLEQGVKRAKNIGKALSMIVVLLLRYFFVKFLGARLSRLYARAWITAARVIEAAWIVFKPHLERWRQKAKQTSNQLLRLALLSLIGLLTPMERLVGLMLRGAKVQGGKLAVTGARASVQVLRPLVSAMLQALRAGFSKPVVQKVLARLLQILEEAQI